MTREDEGFEIYVSDKKTIGFYVNKITASLQKHNKATIMSRGRFNSLGIDIANLVKNKNIGDIQKIDTLTVINPNDKKNVSVLIVNIVSKGGLK